MSTLVVAGLVGATWAASRGGDAGPSAPAAAAARAPAATTETDAGVSVSTRGEVLDAGQVAPARQEAAAAVVQVAARALDNSKGQETAAMETKKRSAGKAAVVCTVAMLLAGETGCVGGPDLRKEPESMACPAGSGDFMRETLGRKYTPGSSYTLPLVRGNDPHDWQGMVEARDGQKLTFVTSMQGVPEGAVFSGQVTLGGYDGKPAAFVRVTYVTIPGGTKGPVCFCHIAPLNEEGLIKKELQYSPVKRLYQGCDTLD